MTDVPRTEKPRLVLESRSINLRLAEVADAEFILQLRLDGLLSRHLSKVENDVEKQREWLRSYKVREQQRQEFYFIIEGKDGEPCGTVRLYDFIGDSFGCGSWVLKQGAPVHFAIESVLMVYGYAFDVLEFQTGHFDVRKENVKVVAFHTRFGDQLVREDEQYVYFELTKEKFEQAKRRYRKYMGGYVKIT